MNSTPTHSPAPPAPPATDLDRGDDPVYDNTTSVVRAVMEMTKGVQQARAEEYLELVKVRYNLGEKIAGLPGPRVAFVGTKWLIVGHKPYVEYVQA